MGPRNFMFRGGVDVIDIHDIPSGFAAVLTGHMHRHQVLQKDLQGKPLATPVLYAGSIERTSFAEKDETKGYITLNIEDNSEVHWKFHELPTRPMISLEVDVTGMTEQTFAAWLDKRISVIPSDSILRVKITSKSRNEMPLIANTRQIRRNMSFVHNVTIELVRCRMRWKADLHGAGVQAAQVISKFFRKSLRLNHHGI
jgi:DNA repair exonuclease SbcCD nuclease subunit